MQQQHGGGGACWANKANPPEVFTASGRVPYVNRWPASGVLHRSVGILRLRDLNRSGGDVITLHHEAVENGLIVDADPHRRIVRVNENGLPYGREPGPFIGGQVGAGFVFGKALKLAPNGASEYVNATHGVSTLAVERWGSAVTVDAVVAAALALARRSL